MKNVLLGFLGAILLAVLVWAGFWVYALKIQATQGQLRKQQELFISKGWPVDVVRSVEDIP